MRIFDFITNVWLPRDLTKGSSIICIWNKTKKTIQLYCLTYKFQNPIVRYSASYPLYGTFRVLNVGKQKTHILSSLDFCSFKFQPFPPNQWRNMRVFFLFWPEKYNYRCHWQETAIFPYYTSFLSFNFSYVNKYELCHRSHFSHHS